MMLFGEKYGESVRVLDIGSSRELCGGTHVARTGDIGLFKIVAESGVAAGVRRVEGVTGVNALAYLQSLEATVHEGRRLKAPSAELTQRIARRWSTCARSRRKSPAQGQAGLSQGDELAGQAVEVKGIRCWPPRWKAPTPRRCARPWTSSRTSSRPPSCWPPSRATRCRSPPA
jgi:alanyl-tRNA synthetase